MNLRLHSYWRSTASYRVRIALHLKGLSYELRTVELRDGAQHGAEFRTLNPQGFVPVLEVDGWVLTQSLAIMEWLEAVAPDPPLLPGDAAARADARALAQIVCCDIHPLNNLRVLNQLREIKSHGGAVEAWIHSWISEGFEAIEASLSGEPWCFGATPGLADCCVVPQVYSAARFGLDLAPFPRIQRVALSAETHPAFIAAHPRSQPDADQPYP